MQHTQAVSRKYRADKITCNPPCPWCFTHPQLNPSPQFKMNCKMKWRLLLKLGKNRWVFYSTAAAASVQGDTCRRSSLCCPCFCLVTWIMETHFCKENVEDFFCYRNQHLCFCLAGFIDYRIPNVCQDFDIFFDFPSCQPLNCEYFNTTGWLFQMTILYNHSIVLHDCIC